MQRAYRHHACLQTAHIRACAYVLIHTKRGTMNTQQALEHALSATLPGIITTTNAMTEERKRNEDAISQLTQAWKAAELGKEPFSFDIVRSCADRNRDLCDSFGIERLERVGGQSLARSLSDQDLIRALACMQGRTVAAVTKSAGTGLQDMSIAYAEAPFRGTILGVDLETTSRYPDRGYIINIGLEFMDLSRDARPRDGHSAYFGMPALYKEKGVPLSKIHHISWDDIADKTPFRQSQSMQKALLAAFSAFPIMAHNAAFEDSWFMLHLDGYAEARKSGKIIVIDSRDICRKLDPEVKTLPRESSPASLENWARRRKTLLTGDKEKHLGLEDVDLMFRTVQQELIERGLLR